jgi:hypothetical protein
MPTKQKKRKQTNKSTIASDHYLYLVGDFLLFGEVEVSNIVRFDVDSQQSESLCGGVNGKI